MAAGALGSLPLGLGGGHHHGHPQHAPGGGGGGKGAPGGGEKLTAEQLRKRGNELYDMRRYPEAIDCYTKAIMKDPSVPTYYTNRALCYLRVQRWELVCKDCHMAVERDATCLKAYYFMGVALMEKNSFDEALNFLCKANDLAMKQRQCFGDEITCMIRACRKRRWSRQEEKRIQQELELQTYLHRLLDEEKQRQIDEIIQRSLPVAVAVSSGSGRVSSSQSQSAGRSLPSSMTRLTSADSLLEAHPAAVQAAEEPAAGPSTAVFHSSGDVIAQAPAARATLSEAAIGEAPTVLRSHSEKNLSSIVDGRISEVERFHQEKKAELDRLLAEMDDRRKKRDVPDYLCGKISFELMRDPVITPSGITYDRRDIDEHLRRVGHFDPVTRSDLTQEMLVPNLAMKEVVDHFLSLNEWAVDY
ncbi:E3 ubiquitin-protein ligase CHIP-like [Paramacrobiotus metropolitanus]|uniref:E3 ubiquitin-protein ligase CHIP-like n=1 Tax=Paramacrobiotus metropolitanus TaxID=2943436 RepID=UPI0024462779|nr:E3 ubiquitin-protein ligase CHIP-like [Paramacrobiotus metropolitanus]XP_055336822.1 E3 ubiquitin-protein ligase CHIP-like [Paramacrobiotus metropolitanus]